MTKDKAIAMLEKFNVVFRWRNLSADDCGVLIGPDLQPHESESFTWSFLGAKFPDYLRERYYYFRLNDMGDLIDIWETTEDGPFDVGPGTRFMRVWIDEHTGAT